MASNGKTIFENTTGLTRHCVLYPEYNENDPYKAIIVESDGLPPVRSNVGFSQPLRPKPPSDGVFRVTPSPNYYPSSNSKIIQTPKYGVNNPHYFTKNIDSSNQETAYGPDDFVVETVKLDKDFFHQFFTLYLNITYFIFKFWHSIFSSQHIKKNLRVVLSANIISTFTKPCITAEELKSMGHKIGLQTCLLYIED